MILKRILQTYSFRFTLLYVVAISLMASLISLLVYLSITVDYFAEVRRATHAELEIAVDAFRKGGEEGFQEHVSKRSLLDMGDRYYFVLARAGSDKVLAGNLEDWPLLDDTKSGWDAFGRTLSGRPYARDFIGDSITLADGYRILVARYYEDVRNHFDLVTITIVQSTIVTIFLGIIGSLFISVRLVQRIDKLNRSIVTIMQGKLSERLPISGSGGEIDQLARQLNIMLDRIENSMQDVKEVSNNIAHDLRTPLTRLRNKLSDFQKNCAPENRKVARDMLVEADHLLSICGALLRISQVESGAKRSSFTDVDLTLIFVDVMELYEPLASVKNIALTISRADPVHIQGDKDLLFQMLVNLIDNSIKYTPSGGAITMSLERHGDKLRMVFSDNGPGIPPEKYTKVFQRFYRVDESRGIQPGNGLGLSLVQAVVELHGGEVWLSDGREFHPGSKTPGLQVNITMPVQV